MANDWRTRLAARDARWDAYNKNVFEFQQEVNRIHDVTANVRSHLDDLDRQFEEKTGLNKKDVAFLFAAVALQCARIYLINKLTERNTAGKGNKLEDKLHQSQEKIFENFDDEDVNGSKLYKASLDQIITTAGVPYDAVSGTGGLMSGNHRFSTLGHDPLIGLVFGTANILTNTITIVPKKEDNIGIPGLPSTYHVRFDLGYSNPTVYRERMATTGTMFHKIKTRVYDNGDYNALVAAVIKQCIHISTDLYTSAGIQLPGLSLILSGKKVQEITEIISTGDVIKAGANAAIAEIINKIISIVHTLTYTPDCGMSKELYNVKTRKIINYSGIIAQSCNIGVTVFKALGQGPVALRDLDFGGLLVCMKNLITNVHVIHDIKMEFIFGNFEKQLNIKKYESIFLD